MGRDDAVDAALVELAEDGFGDGAAGRRLRAGPEFVDEHEGLAVRTGEHVLHVGEEGTVGAEVVVDGLVVSDAEQDAVEDRHFRGLRGRDEHAPLEHILQQPRRLEADGLAAGVGSRDEQDALARGKGDGQGHDAFALFLQGLLEQGVAGLAQVHFPILGDHRHAGDEVEGGLGLGHQEVDLADEDGAVRQLRDAGTQGVAEFAQDARDFPRFGEAEFADLVLELDDLGGLDEGGLAGGGLVVDEARELALAGAGDGDEVASVAD